MPPLSANTAHNLLKQKLEERCTNLTAAFRKVDKSNNGFITPADFSEVMASFGIRVTRPSLMAIVAKYDANGDGFVSYQEFCATMAGKPPSKRLATAPKIAAPAATSRAEEAFRRIIFSEAKSLTEAFLMIDTKRTGFCDAEEFRAVFQRASIEMSAAEVRALIDAYDSNGDGKIDLKELTQLLNTTSRFNDSGRGIKRALVT